MTRWAIPTVTAFAMAAVLFVPLDAAHADLGGALTDALDETVESTGTALDSSVDSVTDAVDGTVGSTGTALDEPVDALTDTVDDVSAAILTTDEEPVTTTTTTAPVSTGVVTDTTTSPSTTSPSTTSPSTTIVAETAESAEDPVGVLPEDTGATIVAGQGDGGSVESRGNGPPNREASSAESLTVLSLASGLTDPAIPEPVIFGSALDSSLYGRLLDWLTSSGSGMRALLLGPLLALEIVFRALLSAGSGLVAPLSLLGAYLAQFMWRSRDARSIVPTG